MLKVFKVLSFCTAVSGQTTRLHPSEWLVNSWDKISKCNDDPHVPRPQGIWPHWPGLCVVCCPQVLGWKVEKILDISISSTVSNNCNVTAWANWTGQCICIDMLDKISSKTKDPCTAPLYEWDTHCNCLSINSEKVKILSFTFFRHSSVHAGLLRRKDNWMLGTGGRQQQAAAGTL